MALLAPFGRYRAFDNNGNPLNGGLLYTYEAGTSTPKDTFTDASENTKNDNPVVLDANGYADVWLESGSYKFVLKDSEDVTLWTTDDISSGSGGSYANSVVVQSTNLNLTSVYEGNLIVCDTALTITLLPAATAGDGFVFIVKNTSSGDVTIDPDGAETIDGSTTYIIRSGFTVNVVSDGVGWVVFGDNIPSFGSGDEYKLLRVNSSGDAVEFSALLDEDDMASDSENDGATQQSIKSYVDNKTWLYNDTTVTLNGTQTEALFSINSDVDRVDFILDDFQPTSDTNIVMQTSLDGGSTWSSSEHFFNSLYMRSNATGTFTDNGDDVGYIEITPSTNPVSGTQSQEGFSGVYQMEFKGQSTVFNLQSGVYQESGALVVMYTAIGGAGYLAQGSKVNAVRFIFGTAGTTTGRGSVTMREYV